MKIFIQWTTDPPAGWVEMDSRDWGKLSGRPDPTGDPSAVVDDQPGWLWGLCVQGVPFTGYDHYVLVQQAQSVFVYVWNDDPAFYPSGRRHGQLWRFEPPAPDNRLGGQINTRQYRTVFGEADWLTEFNQKHTKPIYTTGDKVSRLDWSTWNLPARINILHGILVPETLADAHSTFKAPEYQYQIDTWLIR